MDFTKYYIVAEERCSDVCSNTEFLGSRTL